MSNKLVDASRPEDLDEESRQILQVLQGFERSMNNDVRLHIGAAAAISLLHNMGIQMLEQGKIGLDVVNGLITTNREMLDQLEAASKGYTPPAPGVH